MRSFTLFCLVLIACDETVAPVGDTDVDASRPDVPTPWIYEADTNEPGPTLGATEREAALTRGIALALEVEPERVLALHDLLFPPPELGSGSLDGCPLVLTYDYGEATAVYWQGECTAPDGTRFSGRGTVARYDDFAGEGGVFDGFELTLAGRIETNDGTWLEGAGRVGGYAGGNAQLAAWAKVLEGTFTSGGPRAPADPWLDGSRRPSLDLRGWTYVPTGGRSVTLSGGLSGDGLFAEAVSAVAFEELTLRQALAGATCEREAGGAAAVRASDGTWYDVLFDGATDERGETPAELCDGCGATWHRGLATSPTCFDARPTLRLLP